MANTDFQAVVQVPCNASFRGAPTTLKVWMGHNSGETLIEGLDKLQDAYDGALNIESRNGDIVVELTQQFGSQKGLRIAAATLARRMTRYAGISTTVQ